MRWPGSLAMRTPVVAGGGAVSVSDARRTSQAIMVCKQDYPIADGGQLDFGRLDLGRGQRGPPTRVDAPLAVWYLRNAMVIVICGVAAI